MVDIGDVIKVIPTADAVSVRGNGSGLFAVTHGKRSVRLRYRLSGGLRFRTALTADGGIAGKVILSCIFAVADGVGHDRILLERDTQIHQCHIHQNPSLRTPNSRERRSIVS